MIQNDRQIISLVEKHEMISPFVDKKVTCVGMASYGLEMSNTGEQVYQVQ